MATVPDGPLRGHITVGKGKGNPPRRPVGKVPAPHRVGKTTEDTRGNKDFDGYKGTSRKSSPIGTGKVVTKGRSEDTRGAGLQAWLAKNKKRD